MSRVCVQLRSVAQVMADAEAAGQDWLTAAEQKRLQAITVPARRASFLAGHWGVRVLAAQWQGCAPQQLRLLTDARGRPFLRDAEGAPLPVHVSLSHSADWLAVAVADVPVGVDVEVPVRIRNWQALARGAFTPQERQWLDAAGASDRQIALFHRLWTLKEAYAKRRGTGLQMSVARTVTACLSGQTEAEAWTWAVGAGALALAAAPGVAVESEGVEWGERVCWRYAGIGVGGGVGV